MTTASLAFLLDMASRITADGRLIDAVVTNDNDASILVINDEPVFYFDAQSVELSETAPVIATTPDGREVVLELFVERRMTPSNIKA